MAEKRMRMCSSSYGNDVVHNLSNLRQHDELCDFSVKAKGKSILVHKVLLAATSDYFRAMLCGPMRESKKDCVDLKDLTAEALEHIIDFMYSGEMVLDMENLMETLHAASHLQVHAALDLCSDYIISLITFNNSEQLLHIADTYSLSKVVEHYEEKVLHNFEDFSQTEQFLNLTADQLSRYMSHNALQIRSERILYDLLGKWLLHSTDRLENIEPLVKCIRFALLSEQQLQELQNHWISKRFLSTVKSYLAEGVKYHADAKMGHPWPTYSTKLRSNHTSLLLVHQGTAFHPFEVTGFDHTEMKFYQLVTDISGSRDCRVGSVDNYVYICRVVDCGGGTLMNSLLRFDPRHLSIQELTPCRRLRIDPALVAKDKWLYILGGTNENYSILDSVECYDVRSNTWMDLSPLPTPTHSHAACTLGEYIYVSGGVSGQEQQPTTTLLTYHPSSRSWETRPSMHNSRRLHEMVALQNKLYVLGGIGTHSFHQQTQIPIEVYDPEAAQWTMLSSTLAGRSIGHFIAFQGDILSIGRELYEAAEEDIWSYDVKSDTWKLYTKAPKRTRLPVALCTKVYLNFYEEKVGPRLVLDRR